MSWESKRPTFRTSAQITRNFTCWTSQNGLKRPYAAVRSRAWLVFAQHLERRWQKQTEVLRIRDRFWRYSRRPLKTDPVQGWKIHISATILSASDVFARTFPVLNAHRALYKVPAKLSFLAHLNSGDAGYSQIGKFITVYARSDDEAATLARKLHHVTFGCAAPEIPFDVRYRSRSAVYYRYGSYVNGQEGALSFIIDSVGKAHPDKRAPRSAVPYWLKDPINKRLIRPSKSRSPLGLEFLVHKALAQRGKGGYLRPSICQISHRVSLSLNKAGGTEI